MLSYYPHTDIDLSARRKVCAEYTREPIHLFPEYSGLSVLRAQALKYPFFSAFCTSSNPLTKLSPFSLNISLPVAAYIKPSAESMCPVVCPRSSQSKDSQPPSFFTVIYPPSRPANTPALVRKLCSRRFTSIDVTRQNPEAYYHGTTWQQANIFQIKTFRLKGSDCFLFQLFPWCCPGYTDWADTIPDTVNEPNKITVTKTFLFILFLSFIYKIRTRCLKHSKPQNYLIKLQFFNLKPTFL